MARREEWRTATTMPRISIKHGPIESVTDELESNPSDLVNLNPQEVLAGRDDLRVCVSRLKDGNTWARYWNRKRKDKSKFNAMECWRFVTNSIPNGASPVFTFRGKACCGGWNRCNTIIIPSPIAFCAIRG